MEAVHSMVDKIKFWLAILLVIGGLIGFYYLGDSLMIVRVGVILLGLALGAAVAYTTAPGRQFYGFAQESVVETKKVVWPTRKETIQTTLVVLLFVVAMAVFLWIVDASLMWVVQMVMGRSE
jgi:preprotein translocase subunit SecE